MLSNNGQTRGAAKRWRAGRRSYWAGQQQRGSIMEEGFEKTCHFLQLLTDSGHLTRQDGHLERAESEVEYLDHILNIAFF